MKPCRYCGARIHEDDVYCPDCGERVPRERPRIRDEWDDDEDDRIRYASNTSSGLCTASLITAIIGVVVWVGIFALVVMTMGRRGNPPQDVQTKMMVGCTAMLVVLLNIIGIVLGIVGLQKAASNKWMGVTGLVVNVLQVAFFILIMLIGLAKRDRDGADRAIRCKGVAGAPSRVSVDRHANEHPERPTLAACHQRRAQFSSDQGQTYSSPV